MTADYHTLDELIDLLPRRTAHAARSFLSENEDAVRVARGSAANHQAWEGGYLAHVTETMNLALVLHDALNTRRVLPFRKEDALVALFLHDAEKPWKYRRATDGSFETVPELASKADQQGFRTRVAKRYGFRLTSEQANAIEFAEGEVGSYTPGKRTMGRLAALVHACDVISARLWYDRPYGNPAAWEEGANRPR